MRLSMKIDIIDCRGFVKTPPTIPKVKKVSGQVKKGVNVAHPLKPSIK